jgi:hypothetical protein
MTGRADSNEVVIYRDDASAPVVVEVSAATLRWSRSDCAQGPERRRIRRPFAATIEKIPNLCGPVLRIAATANSGRASIRRRRKSR